MNLSGRGAISFLLPSNYTNFRLEAMRNGEETPIMDMIVFRKIRILLGGKMRLMLAGGAPLSKEVHDFMRVCLGSTLLQGYGLTEVTACATLMAMDDLGTELVGTPNQVNLNNYFNFQVCLSFHLCRPSTRPLSVCPPSIHLKTNSCFCSQITKRVIQ